MRWTIFWIVYFLQIAVTFPNFVSQCEKLDVGQWILYFGHHLTDVFLFWSPLFVTTRSEHLLHILAVLATGLHWASNDNKCILTVLMHQRCGWSEEVWLDSLQNRTELRDVSEYFQFYWIGITLVYDVIRLSILRGV
jgi:hypothetical protein